MSTIDTAAIAAANVRLGCARTDLENAQRMKDRIKEGQPLCVTAYEQVHGIKGTAAEAVMALVLTYAQCSVEVAEAELRKVMQEQLRLPVEKLPGFEDIIGLYIDKEAKPLVDGAEGTTP